MIRPYSFLLSCTLLLSLSSHAQVPCNNYDCVVDKVRKAINKGDYQGAFVQIESADGYPNKDAGEISRLRNQWFEAVEAQRLIAVRARAEAEQARQATEAALRQIEAEKATALREKAKAEAAEKAAREAQLVAEKAQQETKKAFKQVEAEKIKALEAKAEAAEKKARDVLDKIYFYRGSLRAGVQ